MLDLVCEDDSMWGEFFWNWAKTTKKVMWGEKNSSQPRGWEYTQKWCHPESLLSLERLEEGAIYRSSKVAKSVVFNEVPVTSFKIRSFWECFICDILTMHAYIHHVFVVCIICGFFVYIISLRLFKCTYWIIHVLLLFCFFAGWSGWDNHRNGQDGPLFGEDAASISSSINEK